MRNYLALLACLLTSLSLELGHVAGTSQLPRIRGIPASKNSLYQPNQDFECLDGSLLVPFSSVNDDYCDCGDGSDEPGTSACSNGSFYCQNAGHQANFIPSRYLYKKNNIVVLFCFFSLLRFSFILNKNRNNTKIKKLLFTGGLEMECATVVTAATSSTRTPIALTIVESWAEKPDWRRGKQLSSPRTATRFASR